MGCAWSRVAGLLAALLALGAMFPARSQPATPLDPTMLRTMSLAAGCAQCHGTDGRAPADAVAPALAGMPQATFLARVAALRAQEPTPATSVMRRIAAGYSDAQLRTLAAYFAAQTP